MVEVGAGAVESGRDPPPGPEEAGRARGLAALVSVQVLFALFPLFGKWALSDFSPWALAAWRMVVGGAALGLVAFALHGRGAWMRRQDLGRFVVCSLLGIVINILLFLRGLELSTTVNAGLSLPLIPVYTLAIALLLRQERFDPVRGAGIALALAGALVLILQRPGRADLSRGYLAGNLLFVLNTLSYSGYLVLVRPLLARYPPLVVMAWVFLLAVPCVPLFAWGETFVPAGAGPRSWLSLGYSLVCATILAYLLNAYALSKVSASTTAAFIFLQPAIVLGAGVVILGEEFGGQAALAAGLTFAGVWLAARKPRVKQPRPQPGPLLG